MSCYVLELKHKVAVWQGYGLIEPFGHRLLGPVFCFALGVIRPIGCAEADSREESIQASHFDPRRTGTAGEM